MYYFDYVVEGNKYKEEALLRESKVLSKINTPNVVNRIDSKESSNCIYLIEEYTENLTLFDLLQKEKRLDDQTQFRYITQLVNGFIELIKNGIVHRYRFTYLQGNKFEKPSHI